MVCSGALTSEKQPYLAAHRIVVLFFLNVGFVIYSNTSDVPPHYDDYQVFAYIDFDNFFQEYAFSSTHFVADLTFAFNKWPSGTEVFSYQVINLLIHVCTVLLIYQLIFQILWFPGKRYLPQSPPSTELSRFTLILSLIFISGRASSAV